MTGLLVSAALTGDIVTCFAPEQNCASLALNAIETARSEILVNVYALTTGSGIPGALINAYGRGVVVSVVADRRTACARREGLSSLAGAGIPVWIDAHARVAHEKALIIDRRVTIMGSYNFSAGAAWNSEDMNIITSTAVDEAYAAHWQLRLAGAVPFTGPAKWCRR
jgi:phosphatidylserine/phosphatidylglycerophosphate/cardiolipin synthase-like enzyme